MTVGKVMSTRSIVARLSLTVHGDDLAVLYEEQFLVARPTNDSIRCAIEAVISWLKPCETQLQSHIEWSESYKYLVRESKLLHTNSNPC